MIAKNVSKDYGRRRVLDNVTLQIKRGERVAFTGPSGSGKTTLLNCLGGIDRPAAGSILLEGQPLETLSPEELDRLRRQRVGTVFQFFHLLPTLTAFENVELPLQLLGVRANERVERVRAMLGEVGLEHRAEAFPEHLSGGEMQRVAIARAIIHDPVLVLADEPTGNLDSKTGARILDLLETISERHQTSLLMVTHSAESTRICHRTLQLLDGRLVKHGEETVAHSGTPTYPG